MLSSIHPLGERSRHNRFGLTATAHVLGATTGGFAVGVGAGPAAMAAGALPRDVRWALLAVFALVAVGIDASRRGGALPSWHRQVNEDWLGRYRGWVYGFGFGAQLGGGIFTYVTTALVYLVIVVAVLSGSLAGAVVVMTAFGAVRGLLILTAVGVDEPAALWTLHRRLARLAAPIRVGALVTAAATAGVAVGAAW